MKPLNVLLFGATGMVGQGALRECLRDERVRSVTAVGRSVTGQTLSKLHEILQPDLFSLSGIEDQLAGMDTCIFCLGISSVGMRQQEYERITHDLTISVAKTFLRINPGSTFLYISGMGTDSTGQSGSMWARVKGITETELLAMPFKASYMLRPAVIVPLHGIRSKTAYYQAIYSVAAPILPFLRKTFPKYVTTTEELGRKMIQLAVAGDPSRVVENLEITRL